MTVLFYRLVVSSSPKPCEDDRSIELIPLSNEKEFEFEPMEMGQTDISKPSLMMALCRTYIGNFIASAFLKLIADLSKFAGPVILK